jgi:nitrite reductase (NO-forming)
MKHLKNFWVLLLVLSLLAACAPETAVVNTQYILTPALRDGKFVYLGVDGDINGLINPVLHARPGERITVMLINSGEGTHDLVFPNLNVRSASISKHGETTSLTFNVPNNDIALEYHDSRYEKIGMKGVLLVGNIIVDQTQSEPAQPVSVSAPTASGLTVEYTLESGLEDGKMVFIGKGGEIDGQINPDLKAGLGDTVKIHLSSGEGAMHNLYIDELNVQSEDFLGQDTVTVEFVADNEGTFTYYCAVPGHVQAGMYGTFIVGSGIAAAGNESQNTGYTGSGQTAPVVAAGAVDPNAVDVVRNPADLPGPLPNRGPEKVVVELETVELVGKLADGTTFKYWTFNHTVPGPFIRVRVGDTVEVHLKNLPDSQMAHSVDFHATTGPGGGAAVTQTMPGGETMFTFKATNPGLYVYHCATPMVAHHIANGMYGLILVEPEGGLPPVDREFYVMQGELYTAQPFGTAGTLTDDITKLLNETPEYFVFNGAAMGLASEEHMLRANVGETVRIYFGVGGPNFTSSFHVIGEIFDRVYDQASLTSSPLTDVQTTLVPPGGATMVEFKLEVPGRYILVDHALSRLERGLAGILLVEGDDNPDIFDGTVTEGSGH